MAEQKNIAVRGAREHNLRDIDVDLPRDRLIVFTGISGSGKSSLAFDTIYAEGQRRYVYAHLNAFREVYEGMSPERRHFYELIREGAPVRPYFDLEFAREDSTINGDDLTRRWLAVFAGALEEAFYAPTPLFESHRNAALCHGL